MREIRIALAIFIGSSSIRTTSAASIAASDPMAPMAMPMSARRSTGASLMPSPTKASFAPSGFSARSSSTLATLSAGRSSLYTRPTPRSAATCSATRRLSPVSMTVCCTPARFSVSTARWAVGFTTSAMTMWPAYLPSRAMCTMVPTLWQGMHGTPRRSISLSLPAATSMPSTRATTPFPPISWTSCTRLRSTGLPYAFSMLFAIGCEDALSARAAYSSSFWFSIAQWCTPQTSNTPWVSVPVLSKTTTRVLESVSR